MIQPSSPLSPHLKVAPTFFAGIDVGKEKHVAGFVSAALLKERRFEECPTLDFEQSAAGLRKFLAFVQKHVPLAQCVVLVENTGHYHKALCEQLASHGLSIYIIAVYTKRTHGQSKTDRIDALKLANFLYAQLALGLQLPDKSQQIRALVPPTEVALQLRGLVQRREELTQSLTRTKNKLTAISDELFPEFASLFRDPNATIALEVRTHFPTPAIVANKSLTELRVVKRQRGPSDAKLQRLLELARVSIGVTSPARVDALVFEQGQLIESVHHLQAQVDALEARMFPLVSESREGQILLSFPSCGPIKAATLIASIGNIRNFPNKAALRKFCGCAPQMLQTGTSLDRSKLNPTGRRGLKKTLFLLAISAISDDSTVWSKLYSRLVPLKCVYDARKKKYKGKMRVIGRIAGQMVGVLYTLLKQDADLLDSLPDQQPAPPPTLYDPAIHAGIKSRM